jgi:hypothetical protein
VWHGARAGARPAFWPAQRRGAMTKIIQLALFEMEKLQKLE